MTFQPLSEAQIAQLSAEELEQLHADLEALYWAAGKTSFLEFCQRVEVPGAPMDEPEPEVYYSAKVTPAAHHRLLIDAIQEMADRKDRGGEVDDVDGLMVFMPPGSAKALALDTPIPTPSGWTTMGELRVGDQVFDERGKPCKVTWVSPIWKDRTVYRVTTDCGDEIVADEDHEWLVRLCGKRPVLKIKETKQLARTRSKRPMVQRAAPLDLPAVDLPVDPYVLGVWLGDGTSACPQLAVGEEDAKWLIPELKRLGVDVRKNKPLCRYHMHGLRAAFAGLGLLYDPWHGQRGRKHIPSAYMRSSHEQRLALLQGLIDTDGYVGPNGEVQFTSTLPELAHGVAELVRSLGAKASVSENRATLEGRDCGPAWRVYFYLKDAARMPRKASRTRDNERTPDTYLTVEVLPNRIDTVCIEVDSPSHLFLCGRSMTPTHNSTYLSTLAPPWLMGRKPGTNVIAASYGQDLADRFGRRSRHVVRSREFNLITGASIIADQQAVKEWSISNGSDYRAAGLGAGITGFRADWFLIDDPVKGREDADSDTIREKTWQGYIDDVQTRLKPGGKIVIVCTRWHEDDIPGRILGEGWKGQSGLWRGTDGRLWRVICLPLIAEHADDPLGRKEGDLLWPEWFTQKEADRLKAQAAKGGIVARTWASLYQQRPAPLDGSILLRSYWKPWKGTEPPECDLTICCYDTAFEESELGDPSAMTHWGTFRSTSKKKSGEEYDHHHAILLGAWTEHVDAADLADIVEEHYRILRPDLILIEKRASGAQVVSELRRRRLPVKPWLPRGRPGALGKVPRAHAVAMMLETGSVWNFKGPAIEKVLEQCAVFPNGKHDDLVDTVTMALSWLRDRFAFQAADDEADDEEVRDIMNKRFEAKKGQAPRRLYGSTAEAQVRLGGRRAQNDEDEGLIGRMTGETRRRLYGGNL